MALRRIVVGVLALAFAAPARADDVSDVVPPKPLEMPEIAYPEGAVSDRAVIDVEVKLVIAETGDVRRAEILHGAGEPFDAAVLEGVKKFRFSPAMVHGEPASVVVPYTHHFVVPPPPAPVVAEGPVLDAVLLGLVQERGTRRTPEGIGVVARVGGVDYSGTTDKEGHFRIELPAGEAEVRVVDAEHKSFLQREKLASKEELKVRYLIDRASYDPFESIVTGTRERTEVSRTTLTGRELTKIPGTFGDPYRVVTVLPGVTTLMSLLPYPVVRGSSPGNTGELLDSVRLPLLYHLLAGPAIVHPEFIDRVDFYPGGFPVTYGGYTGGILDGLTRRTPNLEPKAEIDLGLTQAGIFLRRTYEPWGITGTFAVRNGYPGALLSLLTTALTLSYWDYQAKLEGPLWGGNWAIFAYGARDHMETGAVQDDGTTVWSNLVLMATHHVDVRWRTGGDDDSEKSVRLVILDDETAAGAAASTSTTGVAPQLRWHEKLSDAFAFDTGLDASLRYLHTANGGSGQQAQAGATATSVLQPDGWVRSGGVFAQGVWKPTADLMVIPGVRADVANDATNTRWSADPRLLARWKIRSGEGGSETWLKGVAGLYHQPPRLALPLPGADEAKLEYELLASRQVGLGAEWKITRAVDLDVQTYFNANSPLLFDLTTNQSLSEVQIAPPTTAPGVMPDYDTSSNAQRQLSDVLASNVDGRAYGIEFMLRKRDAHGFFGWVAYTLSHSERYIDGKWSAYDYDRTHILNVVGGVRLPRNWELGVRVLAQSGTPVTNVHGYNAGRADGQLRFDIRVDKRAVWNEWLLDFYVDVINSMVTPESGGVLGANVIRYVLPTVGFRAVL